MTKRAPVRDAKPKRKAGAIVSRPDIIPSIPEELESVWDKEVAEAFAALRPQQQEFLIQYLQTGIASEAYRRAYNKSASDHLASVSGSQILATLGIRSILLKFASRKTEALFTVLKGYEDMARATKADWVKDENGQYENAGDTPDWQARKEAFIGIRKIHGLDAAEKSEVKVSSEVVIVELPKKK